MRIAPEVNEPPRLEEPTFEEQAAAVTSRPPAASYEQPCRVAPPRWSYTPPSWSWEEVGNAVVYGFFGLLILGGVVGFCFYAYDVSTAPPSNVGKSTDSPYPNERERNEAAVKAYFKKKYPEISDQELDRTAKRVVDAWEQAK